MPPLLPPEGNVTEPQSASMPQGEAKEVAADFPIVGIGASAGGLAAFEAFFSGMPGPPMPGMAFVLVQHLAPDHESLLADLVGRQTDMQVFGVEDGMAVEPGCVYVIPPSCVMALRDGRLRLLEPTEPRGHRLPVDFFFRSLAEEREDKAMCVVLSGTGSDGTVGVREVKGRGGFVVAQDPDSAEYGGMPRSAIATGMVDHVLPAAEIPARLLTYAGHLARVPRDDLPTTVTEEEAFGWIFSLVRNRSGHDFTHYKRNSVARRIARRMAVHGIDAVEEYARHLEQAPEEADALFRDFLIGVTRFFRDPEAFEALQEKGIPAILDSVKADSTVRVWVPGCSTGEEAYSIAILLREQMRAAKDRRSLQIFATDIDGRAIETARRGTYSPSIADDVGEERLERFFSLERGGSFFRIRKEIRDLLVFSEQNLIKDPPFSRINLISCRNVLIYLDVELQKKLMPLFHYALNPDGVLFLGSAESVGGFTDLFTTLDRTARLYQRAEDLPVAPRRVRAPPALASRPRQRGAAGDGDVSGVPNEAQRSLRELVERELLEHHAPVAALVDTTGEILYLHGRMGRFLEPAPGEMGTNVLEMAREGLRRQLTIALHQAAARKDPVRREGLLIQTDGQDVSVDLTVRALSAPSGDRSAPKLLLVVVEDRAESAPLRTGAAGGAPDVAAGEGTDEASPAAAGTDRRVAHLEEELRAKEEYLHAVEEEMQTSNEELRSSIEELQSTNEELQSTNEELETSKEELRSVNEELATINSELEKKVADLSRVENDMTNLLASTGIGTVFVDHALRIQRFTPAATEILNLIDSDVGRPVGHLTSRLTGYDRLAVDTETVLATLVPSEVEVRTEAGAWYLTRIRPYRTTENVIEGAVITFTEITEVKEARETLREAAAERRLAIVVRDASDAVTLQSLEGRIQAWNPGAVRLFGWTQEEALDMAYTGLAPEEARRETAAMIERLARGDAPEPFRTLRVTKDGRTISVWLTVTTLLDESGEPYAFATTEREAADGEPDDGGPAT